LWAQSHNPLIVGAENGILLFVEESVSSGGIAALVVTKVAVLSGNEF
jgi:hypothetical protein